MKKIRKAHDGAFKAKVAIEVVKGERHSLHVYNRRQLILSSNLISKYGILSSKLNRR